MPTEESSGQALTAMPPVDTPKSVDIQEVKNGFTVSVRGGKANEERGLRPYRNDLYIASNLEEVIKIVEKHLEE